MEGSQGVEVMAGEEWHLFLRTVSRSQAFDFSSLRVCVSVSPKMLAALDSSDGSERILKDKDLTSGQ